MKANLLSHRSALDPGTVQVTVYGDAPAGTVADVQRKIGQLARYTGEPVWHARVRLTRATDPAVPLPVTAQGNLDVNGRLVRAQVAARTSREATDLLHDRLRQQLRRLARHWQARRGRQPSNQPHQWRHGQEVSPRPDHYPRPAEEREVVRHKTYGPTTATRPEAAEHLELLDYDFYLFTDADTGQDAVIYRAPPSGYRMAALTPPPPTWPEPEVPLTISEQSAPTLTLPAAVTRLDLSGAPFLFFADPDSGRGRVLYRRYDGHYGLLTPAAEEIRSAGQEAQ